MTASPRQSQDRNDKRLITNTLRMDIKHPKKGQQNLQSIRIPIKHAKISNTIRINKKKGGQIHLTTYFFHFFEKFRM